MTEYLHSQDGSGAAAQNGREEEGPLGNPPLVLPGFLFVQAHKQESQKIDEG